MTESSRVVIVEDDEVTRLQLVARVNAIEGFTVSAHVASKQEALACLAENTPDVLLVDLNLLDGSGIDIIDKQSNEHPALPILVVSALGDEATVIRAIERGAQGYMLKSDSSLAIEDVLQQLVQGGAPMSAGIARYLIQRLRPKGEAPETTILSAREVEVLTLAAKGYSYREIAGMLDISPTTVSSFSKRIYQKLAVHSKSEAVYEAVSRGIVKIEPDSS